MARSNHSRGWWLHSPHSDKYGNGLTATQIIQSARSIVEEWVFTHVFKLTTVRKQNIFWHVLIERYFFVLATFLKTLHNLNIGHFLSVAGRFLNNYCGPKLFFYIIVIIFLYKYNPKYIQNNHFINICYYIL